MKITIPKPCHENWDAMTPEDKGRFCAVCNQTVQDFTQETDAEINDFFAEHPQNVCGNFKENQLDRNLDFSFLNSLLAKFAIGLTLTAGGSISVEAQEKECGTNTNSTKETCSITTPILKGKVAPRRVTPIDSLNASIKRRERAKLHLGKVLIDTPLYIVDKKELSEQNFKQINTNDIRSIKVLKGEKATEKYGNKARFGAVVVDTKNDGIKIKGEPHNAVLVGMPAVSNNSKPLYILDKKEVSEKDFNNINPDTIKAVTVLKNEKAVAIYGEKGKNGVIIIQTKKKKKSKK